MRQFLMVAGATLLALVVSCSGPNVAFVKGVDALTIESGLLDEYEGYVKADPSLSGSTKEIRTQTSKDLRRLIEEAKKEE